MTSLRIDFLARQVHVGDVRHAHDEQFVEEWFDVVAGGEDSALLRTAQRPCNIKLKYHNIEMKTELKHLVGGTWR